MQNLNIQHDLIKHIFFTRVRDGMARLNYKKPEKNVMEFTDTYVPSSDRGKGIGASLIEYAITFARERDLKVVATCPFANHYLESQSVER